MGTQIDYYHSFAISAINIGWIISYLRAVNFSSWSWGHTTYAPSFAAALAPQTIQIIYGGTWDCRKPLYSSMILVIVCLSVVIPS